MAEKFIVAAVFAGGTARITASSDLSSLFRKWNTRYGPCLPVIAFRMTPNAFIDAFHIHRLPKIASTDWAAEHLHRAPIVMDAQLPVLRHIRRLGDGAVPLLAEWLRAVKAVVGDGTESPRLVVVGP